MHCMAEQDSKYKRVLIWYDEIPNAGMIKGEDNNMLERPVRANSSGHSTSGQ